MARKHPSIKGLMITKHLKCMVRGLCAGTAFAALAACAQPAGTVMDTISEISIERDCSGCATGSVLVLRSDGTATLNIIGKARHATADSTTTRTLRREDFEALARLAQGKGFFEMKDIYEDPELQDGAWVTTRVLRGKQDKRVIRRDAAGPEALKQLEAAITALQSRIGFTPVSR
jgi:hypothetical protein